MTATTSTAPPVSQATYSRIGFRVAGIPAPKGSARAITDRRTGKARLVASSSDANKAAQQAWAASVGWAAKAACRGRVLTGPVLVLCEFVMPRPPSHGKAERAEPWHAVKPDCDKLIRSTLDALTGIAYTDDARVSAPWPIKRYATDGEASGAWIAVVSLGGVPARMRDVLSVAVEAAEEMSA